MAHVDIFKARLESVEKRIAALADDSARVDALRTQYEAIIATATAKRDAAVDHLAISRARKRDLEFDAVVARSDLARAEAVKTAFEADAALPRVERALARGRTALPLDVCKLIAKQHAKVRAKERLSQIRGAALSITVDFAGDVVSPQGVSVKAIIVPKSCSTTPATTQTTVGQEVGDDGVEVLTLHETHVPGSLEVGFEMRVAVSDLGVPEIPVAHAVKYDDFFYAYGTAAAFCDTIARIHKRTGCPKKPIGVEIESTIGAGVRRLSFGPEAWKKRGNDGPGTIVGEIVNYFRDVGDFFGTA